MSNKVPPQNLDAERGVLGAILLDSEVLVKVSDILVPQNFYSVPHGLIYEAIVNLYRQLKAVDVVTVSSELKKMNKLSQVGGAAYLSELIAAVPTAAHAEEYARLIKESSVRRQLISLGGELGEMAFAEDKPLVELMDTLEAQVFGLSQDSTKHDFKHTSELLERFMEQVEEYAKNPGAMRGIPTGLAGLDGLLGGLHNSDLVIVAARPAVGKSSIAADIGRFAAVEEKKSVGYFSLEMPDIQVVQRLLAQQVKIDLFTLRMGKFSDKEYALFAEGMGKLSEAKLYVDDTPGLNVMQLRSKARKLKMEKGLDLIIVDYLQLMQGRAVSRPDNRAQEVSEISRSLKLLARELDVPVIALSQLNRAVESRGDNRPQLSDLRESGSIEQDADVVIFLSRNLESDQQDLVSITIAKHRNGPVGTVDVRFDPKTTSFSSLTNG